MTQSAITLSEVTVSYQEKIALRDISLSVPQGSICGLIGMNGAGKSTLFKTIMGLIAPLTGTVTLSGQSIVTAQKQGIVAYVPQSEDIDWHFPVSVHEVVMMGRYQFMGMTRTPRKHDVQQVETALNRVHLRAVADRQIGQLSGGQRKRVFVARALAQGATLLLLDEPFAGVDATTEQALVKLLKELQSQGVTTLITAHDLSRIGTYCDHMILLNKTIVAAGPTRQVFTQKNIAATYETAFSLGESA